MAINKKYSFKDFTHQSFKNSPASDFNDSEVKGSCFYQEAKESDGEVLKDIFPDGIMGVVFQRCNLDNVLIPLGNTIEKDCTHRRIKVQNDLSDWILDDNLKPVEPMDKKQRLIDGRSIDPKDIPVIYSREEIIVKVKWDETYGVGNIPDKSWFKALPQIIKTDVREGVVSQIQKPRWDAMVKDGIFGDYDSKPQVIKEENIKMRTRTRGIITVLVVTVKGIVTTYTIKGNGKLTRQAYGFTG